MSGFDYRLDNPPTDENECVECSGTGDLGDRMMLDNDGNIVSMALLQCPKCAGTGIFAYEESEAWKVA